MILDNDLLSSHGLLLIDNSLYKVRRLDARWGASTNPTQSTPYAPHPLFDEGAKSIIEVNDLAIADDRVDTVMLPIRDGVTICRLKK